MGGSIKRVTKVNGKVSRTVIFAAIVLVLGPVIEAAKLLPWVELGAPKWITLILLPLLGVAIFAMRQITQLPMVNTDKKEPKGNQIGQG